MHKKMKDKIKIAAVKLWDFVSTLFFGFLGFITAMFILRFIVLNFIY